MGRRARKQVDICLPTASEETQSVGPQGAGAGKQPRVSRRDLLKGAATAAIGAAVTGSLLTGSEQPAAGSSPPPILGPTPGPALPWLASVPIMLGQCNLSSGNAHLEMHVCGWGGKGNRLSEQNPAGGQNVWTCTSYCRASTYTDESNNQWSRGYDSHWSLTSITDPNTGVEQWTRNSDGSEASHTSPACQ